MIANVYGRYFQKSRTFLLPLLGLKHSNITRVFNTYLSWEGQYTIDNKKLILLIDDFSELFRTKEFIAIEQKILITSTLYEKTLVVEGGKVHIFDLSIIGADWDHFVQGKYSLLSKALKQKIKNYYGADSSEWDFVESFLYPEKYYDLYAQLLGVEVNLLHQVGELCNIFNPENEELHLELISNFQFSNTLPI
jgi:hypothetical protein